MADLKLKPPVTNDTGLSAAELIAIALSAFWIIAVGIFFLVLPPATNVEDRVDSLRIVMIVIAVFMPVAMIWVAAIAARSARIVRAEGERLRVAVDGMRETYVATQATKVDASTAPTVEKTLSEIAEAAKKTESTLATFASSREGRGMHARPVVGKVDDEDQQPALALGTSTEDMAPPLSRPDLIRALNFPDTDKDAEGFAAL